MFTLINGSPKLNLSNSKYFLDTISKNIDYYNIFDLKNKNYENILESIKNSDTIVFAFPLYVDSPPSIVLEFLDYIFDNKINLNNKMIYTTINCGFREGEQNICAINIIKNWCNKVNASYGSSILIGAGEIVGKQKFKFISKNTHKKLNIFTKIILSKKKSNDIITTIDILNNKMYCKIGNIFWNKNARKNHLTKDDLLIK